MGPIIGGPRGAHPLHRGEFEAQSSILPPVRGREFHVRPFLGAHPLLRKGYSWRCPGRDGTHACPPARSPSKPSSQSISPALLPCRGPPAGRTPYGVDAAAINMVIVDEACPGQGQGQGLGKRLMRQCPDAADGRVCQLVAAAEGLPLYERLGFAAADVASARPRSGRWRHRHATRCCGRAL